PATLTLDLNSAFDSPPVGDQQTTFATVTLVGTTEASAQVKLQQTGVTTTADGSGHFSFTSVPLVVGANAFQLTATDTAGNSANFTRTITRLADTTPPTITVALSNDTGANNSDGNTMDVGVSGTVSDLSPVTLF